MQNASKVSEVHIVKSGTLTTLSGLVCIDRNRYPLHLLRATHTVQAHAGAHYHDTSFRCTLLTHADRKRYTTSNLLRHTVLFALDRWSGGLGTVWFGSQMLRLRRIRMYGLSRSNARGWMYHSRSRVFYAEAQGSTIHALWRRHPEGLRMLTHDLQNVLYTFHLAVRWWDDTTLNTASLTLLDPMENSLGKPQSIDRVLGQHCISVRPQASPWLTRGRRTMGIARGGAELETASRFATILVSQG